jgi:hypothetical protein
MKEYYTKHPKLVWCIIILCAFFAMYPLYVWLTGKDVSKLGQVGDSFNILATIVNIITVVFLGMTLSEQRKAYGNQEIELNDQRKYLISQNEVMTKQLEEMKISRSLESARDLHTQIVQFFRDFRYNGGFKNSCASHTSVMVGYATFAMMKRDLHGGTVGDIGNLETNRAYISQLRPIVQLIKAFVDISNNDTTQILMLRAIIPDGFRQICLNLAGPDTDDAAYNDFMRDREICEFRHLVRSIPDGSWS